MIRVGYVRGPVANHQDYDCFSRVHKQSGKEINIACCSTAEGPGFSTWDPGEIEFYQYSKIKDLFEDNYFQILDTSEFYRDYSRDIILNYETPVKRVVTVFDNLPFGISENLEEEFDIVDAIIVRAPMIKNAMLLQGAPPEKIHFVPSAVNTEYFRPSVITGQDPKVLFVGRMVPEKGLWDVIVAMSGLEAELQVVGTASQSEIDAYMNLARNANTQVRFLGEQSHENLTRVMQSAAILVVPSIPKINVLNPEDSWVEQFGVVLLEGMSSGLPILASDTGDIRNIIVDGQTGYLFPPRSWDILRNQIIYLLKNQSVRNQMGSAGRDRVKRLFSSDAVGKKLAEVYLSL